MNVKVLPILCASVLIAVAKEDSLLTPCRTDDVQCLIKTTSQFLSNTCKGIPEYDIQPIDPLTIRSTDYEVPGDSGLIFYFKNLMVTGLKDQQFLDLKMNIVKQGVVLTTKADVIITGDVTLKINKRSKTVTGPFTIIGSVAGTATYGYSFKKDDKGVTHYEVGPEKITCQVLGEPLVTMGFELESALNADPEVAMRQKCRETSILKKGILRHITAKSYITVIHNLRAAAKILPTTSFLIGV